MLNQPGNGEGTPAQLHRAPSSLVEPPVSWLQSPGTVVTCEVVGFYQNAAKHKETIYSKEFVVSLFL